MQNNNTTAQVVAKDLSVKDLFRQPSVRERFEEVFGERGKEHQPKTTAFLLSAINVVSNNELLAVADRDSLLFAVATAATVDLPINANLGFAYIVPYKKKAKGADGKWTETVLAQFQMGYKGFVQLAQRSGQFKTISATPIRENQIVTQNPLTGYEFDFEVENPGEVVGYAGYFELLNGFSKTFYMSVAELRAHGLEYSQSYKKGYGLWKDNFDAMATKTVLKLLLSKFAPLSIQMQAAILADQATGEGEYPDNQRPDLAETQKEKELERLHAWIEASETIDKLQEANEAVYASQDQDLIDAYELKMTNLYAETQNAKDKKTKK